MRRYELRRQGKELVEVVENAIRFAKGEALLDEV
jgi:hypothetical protein